MPRYLSRKQLYTSYYFNKKLIQQIKPPTRTVRLRAPAASRYGDMSVPVWKFSRVLRFIKAHNEEFRQRWAARTKRKAAKQAREREARLWAWTQNIHIDTAAVLAEMPAAADPYLQRVTIEALCKMRSNLADLEAEAERRWPGQRKIWRESLRVRFRVLTAEVLNRIASNDQAAQPEN
jgi:hypothetical protein